MTEAENPSSAVSRTMLERVTMWLGPLLLVAFFGGLFVYNTIENRASPEPSPAKTMFPGCGEVGDIIGEEVPELEPDSFSGGDKKDITAHCIFDQSQPPDVDFALRMMVAVLPSEGYGKELSDFEKDIKCSGPARSETTGENSKAIVCAPTDVEDHPAIEAGYLTDSVIVRAKVFPPAEAMKDYPQDQESLDWLIERSETLVERLAHAM